MDFTINCNFLCCRWKYLQQTGSDEVIFSEIAFRQKQRRLHTAQFIVGFTGQACQIIAQAGINKQDMETEPKAKKETNSSSGCLPHGTCQRKHSVHSKIWLEDLNIYVEACGFLQLFWRHPLRASCPLCCLDFSSGWYSYLLLTLS